MADCSNCRNQPRPTAEPRTERRLRNESYHGRTKKPESARYEDVPEPDAHEGSILVEAIAVGVCGTDVEIVEGKYGWAPPGETRLVLGHESLGRVIDPGPSSSFKKGDLVVGIVRRPDPVPCPNCAVGEWDMCRNGQYTERGIKQIHGYMSERWRIEPEYAIKVDASLGLLGVLLEPATVIAKALEQVVDDRPAVLLGTADRAGDGRGPDRLAGGSRRQDARHGCPCAGPDGIRHQAGFGPRPGRHLPYRIRQKGRLCAGRHHRMHRGGPGDCRFDPGDRLGRDGLPDRRRAWRRRHGGRHARISRPPRC